MITRRDFGLYGLYSAGLGAIAALSPSSLLSVLADSNEGPSGEGAITGRTGVRPHGAYFGRHGEHVDLLSGNLCFTVPLLKAESRGARALIALTYNSQPIHGIRRARPNDAQLGTGYGWRLQIASIIPQTDGQTITGYVYVDGSGASYALTKVGDRWIGRNGRFMSWFPETSTLYFADGHSFVFGSESGIKEADSGALYPTLVQCSNGNQISILYLKGIGESKQNTSSRISEIRDARSGYSGSAGPSYLFIYSADLSPRLLSIASRVSTDESYSFTYSSQLLSSSRNGLDDASSVVTLTEVSKADGTSRQFIYNANGGLEQVSLPTGGIIWWQYTSRLTNSASISEVVSRSAKDPQNPASGVIDFTFERQGSAGSYSQTSLYAQDGSKRILEFVADPQSPQFGLLTSKSTVAASGSTLVAESFAWARTDLGSPYVATHVTTKDPESANAVTMRREQSRDRFGNLLETRLFDYSSATEARVIVSQTYLATPSYLNRHILDRVTDVIMTNATESISVVSNKYDTTQLISRPGATSHNAGMDQSVSVRGNITESHVEGIYRRMRYDTLGRLSDISDSEGWSRSYIPDAATNFTRVKHVIPSGNPALASTISYERGLPVSTVSASGSSTFNEFDELGRLKSVTYACGNTTSYSYSTSPASTTNSTNGVWERVTLDGFGRRLLKEEGSDDLGTLNMRQFEYGASGLAPYGLLKRLTLPHSPDQAQEWVSFQYDALGRHTLKTNSMTGATVRFDHLGNFVVIKDGVGNWKKLVHSATRQLTKVVLPNPKGGKEIETNYSYGITGRLINVAMPRTSGTQQRRFAYDEGGRIVKSVQPETGETTYSYNSDGTLQSQVDAKRQKTVFTRDIYKRLTSVARYSANGELQPNDSVDFFYGRSPLDDSTPVDSSGRLTAVAWGKSNSIPGRFTESYGYTGDGKVALQRLTLERGDSSISLDIKATYNANGQVETLTYPLQPALKYSYDSLGRPIKLTKDDELIVKDATYSPQGKLDSLKILSSSEAGYIHVQKAFGSNHRLTEIVARLDSGDADSKPILDLSYAYRNGDGRVHSEADRLSGRTVVYDYDNHGRLSAAETSDPGWGLRFEYDEFGNRTSQTITKGQAFEHHVQHDPATNWMIDTATSYDANGNIVNLPDLNMEYDTKNRLTAVRSTMNGLENYSYNHQDLRVWRFSRSQETITLYWKEKRIGTYILALDSSGKLFVRLKSANIYFRNQVVRSGPNAFVSDRLGAARVWIGQNKSLRSANYLPFGEQEKGINDTDKSFDGYEKDSQTGLCYAKHRYYAPSIGRFITADPYSGSAHPSKPDSWNRYAFVLNDPINKTDPSGLAPGKQNACAGTGSSYTGANAANDAAEAAVMNVSTATADYDNEYAGGIIKDDSTGSMSFTSPVTSYNNMTVNIQYSWPAGYSNVAGYHTHTAQATDDFSALDISWVHNNGVPLYLGGSDGTFAVLTVAEANAAYDNGSRPTPGTVLGGKGTVSNGPPTTCGGSSAPKD